MMVAFPVAVSALEQAATALLRRFQHFQAGDDTFHFGSVI